MKKHRQNILQKFSVLLLFTLIMIAAPSLASAANTATLELANNRSEAVYVTVQSWDASRNTHFTKGWFLVNPNASTKVTIENYGDWEQVLWLYATSKTNVWQGDPNANLSDPDLSALVNTSIKFQYWGHGGQYAAQKGWQTVYLFSVKENGTHGNFIYSFE